MYDSRVNTARSLSAAIERASPPKRPNVFVQISGVGFYPRDDQLHEGKVYDETYDASRGVEGKVATTDFFTDLTRDMEKAAALTKDVEMDTRQVIVRSGVVLGRTGGLIQRIFPSFFLGLGGPFGSGDQPLPWIHVKDLVGIITLAIEKEFVCGVLNATAPEMVTNRQFVEAFARSMWRPAVVPVPEVVWNAVFGEERAKIVTRGQRVDCKRTLEVGYQFRFGTISQACREFCSLFYVDQDTSLGE